MNLIDLLAPKWPIVKRALEVVAEVAEKQQLQCFGNPPPLADRGGKAQSATVSRRNPPPLADGEARAITTFPPNPPNPPPASAAMDKPLPVSRDYFASQGVDLLPDDLAFLRWHLPRDTAARNKAINAYIETWQRAMDCEPLKHRKANRGRFAANTWLRRRQAKSEPFTETTGRVSAARVLPQESRRQNHSHTC